MSDYNEMNNLKLDELDELRKGLLIYSDKEQWLIRLAILQRIDTICCEEIEKLKEQNCSKKEEENG